MSSSTTPDPAEADSPSPAPGSVSVQDDIVLPPLTPEQTGRPDISGVPLRIGDHDWLFAYGFATPELDEVRTRLEETGWLRGTYTWSDVEWMASVLLGVNYELTPPEILTLIYQADPQDLCDVLGEALFPYVSRARTTRDWVRSSLIANGLDPDQIRDEDLPHVLHQLVKTGRAMPVEHFTDLATAAVKRRKLLDGVLRVSAPSSKPEDADGVGEAADPQDEARD